VSNLVQSFIFSYGMCTGTCNGSYRFLLLLFFTVKLESKQGSISKFGPNFSPTPISKMISFFFPPYMMLNYLFSMHPSAFFPILIYFTCFASIVPLSFSVLYFRSPFPLSLPPNIRPTHPPPFNNAGRYQYPFSSYFLKPVFFICGTLDYFNSILLRWRYFTYHMNSVAVKLLRATKKGPQQFLFGSSQIIL
jgi:hypothetical protein